MTQRPGSRQSEIESLLAERRKYEAWLAQLETRRAAAAAHVFTRVHEDYRTRLREVSDRLAAEAGTIADMVERLEARLGEEQAAVAARVDERAEAELRAAVGEFSEKEWASARSKHDAAIAELRATFDATERELADLKDLLRSVSGAPGSSRASLEAAAIEVVDADLGEGALEAADDEGTRDGGAAGETMPPVEEDAMAAADARDSVSGAPAVVEADGAASPGTAASTATGAKPVAALPSADATDDEATPAELAAAGASADRAPDAGAGDTAIADGPPVPPATPFDELAFLRSVAGTPARAPRVTAPTQEPTGADATAQVPLGGPTPRTSQAVRSLKCGECGTLNFPTEWYCERCGGELAAF